MQTDTITYEQPLNEHMRVCLRLEHLFQKFSYFINQSTAWDLSNALATILDIVNVLDRPDLKSKLYNALRMYTESLLQLEQIPDIDKEKLSSVLYKLDQSRDILHNISGKLGQQLRDNEFLNAVRQRLTTPAGTCNYSLPSYQLWLQRPHEEIKTEINNWYSNFNQLQEIINLLLELTRNSSSGNKVMAEHGFYQESLAPEVPYQLIRVILPLSYNVFPEISVGRHRLSIYFYNLNIETRASMSTKNIEFKLICCKI